jgi:6-phosphogluconolactonase
VLVPDKGLDRVFVLAVDGERLAIVSETAMRPGAGPRHIAFHPHAPLAFLVNELDSSVATCRWDAEAGTLTPLHLAPTLPPDFFGASTAAAIVVTPDGRFVYASNRGQDGIARFRVDEAGRLDPAGWTPSGGRDPRFMVLAPDGRHLLVANEQGDSLVDFAIDADGGDLTRTGSRPSPSPCTIAFL